MSDVDDLMDLDPLGLSDRDLDAIVAYHRNRRVEPGARASKETKVTTSVDLSALIQRMVGKPEPPKAAPKTGLRRV